MLQHLKEKNSKKWNPRNLNFILDLNLQQQLFLCLKVLGNFFTNMIIFRDLLSEKILVGASGSHQLRKYIILCNTPRYKCKAGSHKSWISEQRSRTNTKKQAPFLRKQKCLTKTRCNSFSVTSWQWMMIKRATIHPVRK